MTSIVFDWDAAKAAGNRRKHGVTFDEASTVFMDGLSLSIPDPASEGEERWITLGETATGQLVLVVHTWWKSTIRSPFVSSQLGARRAGRSGNIERDYEERI